MNWRIDYTNEPWLKKRRRKELEVVVAKLISRIEGLLQTRTDEGFVLGKSGFSVESLWVERVHKHLLVVHDLRRGNIEWVASIMFDRHPCMGVGEAKSLLRKLGLSETDIYGLTSNSRTVGELLAELEAELNVEIDEHAKQIRLVNKALLESLLEEGIIKASDSLLDVSRKIREKVCNP